MSSISSHNIPNISVNPFLRYTYPLNTLHNSPNSMMPLQKNYQSFVKQNYQIFQTFPHSLSVKEGTKHVVPLYQSVVMLFDVPNKLHWFDDFALSFTHTPFRLLTDWQLFPTQSVVHFADFILKRNYQMKTTNEEENSLSLSIPTLLSRQSKLHSSIRKFTCNSTWTVWLRITFDNTTRKCSIGWTVHTIWTFGEKTSKCWDEFKLFLKEKITFTCRNIIDCAFISNRTCIMTALIILITI